eukprot:GHVL01043897.1.p1 GENE.GHVL01043897.1~~GHVL01043897.1.p1  ORF type:complete len:340 (+),score=65.89 GHVL01043897.1:473-1492(+)
MTPIDPASAAQLISTPSPVTPQHPVQYSQQLAPFDTSPFRNSGVYPAQSSVRSIGGDSIATAQSYLPNACNIPCKTHPDEQVAYFCLQCECPCICAECVIHGEHKNHDVQKIKRAYGLIKSKVEDFVVSVNSRIEEMSLSEQRVEAHRRDVVATVSSAKQQLTKSFEEVRQRVARKEQDLSYALDAFLRSSDNDIENQMKITRQKMVQLQGSSEKIRRYLSAGNDQASQVMLLNFFSESKGLLNTSKDSVDEIQLPALQRQVSLDVESVNRHIEALQGLHVSISNLQHNASGIYPQGGGNSYPQGGSNRIAPSTQSTIPTATVSGGIVNGPNSGYFGYR